jgi:hypothetical protein
MRAGIVALAIASVGCGRFGFGVLGDGEDETVETSPDASVAKIETYRATAVRFQTANNDFMWTGALEETVNSGRGTFSAWFRFTAGDDQLQMVAITQVVGFGGVFRTASNQFQFLMQNCLGVPIVDMRTAGEYTTASGWTHVLASWDAAQGRADLYINGVPDRADNPTIVNGNICYDTARWGLAGWTSGRLDADVADMYATLGTYIDITDEANRRLFTDVDGRPVDLGRACVLPTGSPPSGCFVGDPSTWHTNQGSAEGFNLEGDGLAESPTSPSD